MSGDRSIRFTIPGSAGSPGVEVYIVEDNGKLIFSLDVLDNSKPTADLRGLFFNFSDPGKLAGLSYTGGSGLIAGMQAKAGKINDLGHGVNMNGAVKGGFDAGLEFGGPGIGKDKADVSGPVSFTLDNAAHNLTLDDVANTLFGARLTSVGSPTGQRSDSAKLTFVAPAAPNAHDDSYSLFEDGQSGLDKPSHTPIGTLFQVLSNDTDADGDKLTITSIEGVQHGTAIIVDGNDADTLVGDAILYTPFADYAGTDSFLYRVTDNHGGTDAARVNLNINAVADAPTLTYEIKAGDSVNEVRLIVTATQTDLDKSEFVDRISLSNLPANVVVSEKTFDPDTKAGQLVHEFVLKLPENQDVNFDLGISAWSKEISNGDEQVTTKTVPITLEHTLTHTDAAFHAVDQSIWNNGSQFTFTDDRFLGIDTSWTKSGGTFVEGSTDGHIKAGFQSTLKFEGGEIDASVPYDISVETNYNKTTDVLYLTADAVLGSATFATEGPEGSYKLDFLYDLLMHATGGLDFGELGTWDILDATVGPYSGSFNILNLTSDNLGLEVPLGAGFSLNFQWPNIDTASAVSSTNVINSSGASNNFLTLGLDVDDLIFKLLKIPNPFDIPIDLLVATGNAEIADLDLSAGLNFLQKFKMTVADLAGTIKFEDGLKQAFNFNEDITLNNASSHDMNHDGHIDFELSLAPNASLQNDTDLGFNFGYQFDALKLSGSYDVIFDKGSLKLGPVYSVSDTIPLGAVSVYDNTFALNFQSSGFEFHA